MDHGRLKILCVAPELPRPDVAAGDLRFFAILQILAKHHKVDLFVLDPTSSQPELSRYRNELQRIGVHLVKEGYQNFETVAAQKVYDVGLFEFWQAAHQRSKTLQKQQPWVHTIVDSVDIHFVREEAGLLLGISDPKTVELNKKRELEAYSQADTVVVVTPEDEVQLRAYGTHPSTTLIPMIVSSRLRVRQERRPEIVFIGGFRHAPNADGLIWFIREVWPTVYSRVPDVRLTIIGSYAPPEIQQMAEIPGVHFEGFVLDTKPYLDRAFLSIAPLRFGAGMKGKVTEAMASGVPVVTTNVGAQGLEATPRKHLIVTDEPKDFAEQVVALLNSPEIAQEIGLAGQQHVESICGFDVIERRLTTLLDTIRPEQSTPTHLQSARLAFYRVKASIKTRLRYAKRLGKKTLISTRLIRVQN